MIELAPNATPASMQAKIKWARPYGRAVDTAGLLAQKTVVFQQPQTSAQIEKEFRSAKARISSVPIIRYPNFAMVT